MTCLYFYITRIIHIVLNVLVFGGLAIVSQTKNVLVGTLMITILGLMNYTQHGCCMTYIEKKVKQYCNDETLPIKIKIKRSTIIRYILVIILILIKLTTFTW